MIQIVSRQHDLLLILTPKLFQTYLSSLTAGGIFDGIDDSTSLWCLLTSCGVLSATLVQSELFPVSLFSEIFFFWYKPSWLLV